jgi:ligand-binding sensor domain-containing protein/serine phosphatase RsbU (regulator of sigma subunit)
MKRIFLFIWLFIGLIGSYCQKYSFTNFSIKDGLPNSSVRVLFQDSRSLIWIGTNGGGVAQYDGYSFYTLSENNGLVGNQVNSIAEDNLGRIWFGTNKGVSAFDGKTISDFSEKIFKGYVDKLYFDKKGFLWILTANSGAIRTNPNDIGSGKETFGLSSGLKTNTFIDIVEDNFGRFWLVSDHGLVVFSPDQSKKEIRIGIETILPDDQVSSIDTGSVNEMWIGTRNSGVFLLQYDSLSCELKRSYNSYFDNIDDNIVAVRSDINGNVWLGTDDNGLIYIDYPFVKTLTKDNGLGSNQITDILKDKEGNVWIGTVDQGVKVFSGWQFVHYDTQSGLPDNSINSLAQDFSDNYWCSGNTGLFRIIRRNDQIKVSNVLLPEEYSEMEISCIVFPSADEVIFGTTKNGILWIKNNAINLINAEKGLPGNQVNSIYIDAENKIWVGTQNGLAKIDNGLIVDISKSNAVFESGVNSITSDDNGTIWVGTNQGIVGYLNDSVVILNEENGLKYPRVNSVLTDNYSNLWIGTMGGGLYQYKIKPQSFSSQQVKHYLTDDVLVSDNIYSLAIYHDTILIIGTDKGANKIHFIPDSLPVIKSIFSYNNSNGFYNQECNLNAVIVDEEGNIWFGTKTGLTCFDPAREKPVQEKPKIFLTGLEVNFEAVKWQSAKNKPDEWFSFPSGLKLKHNQNYVDFTFSGVYYSEGLQYQYFMEGLDKDWSKVTSQRFINFSKLSPGKYNFRVRALTKSGLISDETSFAFIIKPPFWRTWWFIILMVILAIFSVIQIIKFREKQLKEAKIILEDTVKKRTEEIREQKTRIEKQKEELTDSIVYAKRLQDAVISKPEDMRKFIDEYFIIFLPRDIVSGDFYWFAEVDNKFVFSVADCTGHGVPGAFMSMLGIRLLNEIVLERKITAPDEILGQLRAGVIQALQQEGANSDTRDGMDMSLCTFDKDKNRLYYAGAYNPLWLIRNNELIIYKADRMPVAIYDKLNRFTCYDLECKMGDLVYLFSDGFPDQFGGPELKKYKPKRLEEILLSIANLPMDKQKEALLNDFYSWKGNTEQIDDVSLMGVKF